MEMTTQQLDDLLSKIPCRKQQITTLFSLMQHVESSFSSTSIFVYGHTATGKTLIVKSILSIFTETPHAFINCVEMITQRILLESIMQQLRNFSSTTSTKKIINMNDFVLELKEIIDTSQLLFIVLDKAERLRNLGKHILPAFLKLQEILDANICVIFISELPWEKFRTNLGICDPLAIHFANYTQAELEEILSRDHPLEFPEEFYRGYIGVILSLFFPMCRDLNELRYLARINYKTYCEPIKSGELHMNDRSKLWRIFDQHMRKSLQQVYSREVSRFHYEERKVDSPLQPNGSRILRQVPKIQSEIVLELPLYSKYLLIAAYLASYNPTKTDQRFFLKHHGRIKKTMKEMKKNERLSSHVLGPKAFPLDRLLAIFYSIVEENVTPSAFIFSQISTLVSLHLLSYMESVDVLQTPKYRCLISLDSIRSIARTVNFDVIRYLYDFI